MKKIVPDTELQKLRPDTKPVPEPVISGHCRECGCEVRADEDLSPVSGLFTLRRMLANPNDPVSTYVCPPCDKALAKRSKERRCSCDPSFDPKAPPLTPRADGWDPYCEIHGEPLQKEDADTSSNSEGA